MVFTYGVSCSLTSYKEIQTKYQLSPMFHVQQSSSVIKIIFRNFKRNNGFRFVTMTYLLRGVVTTTYVLRGVAMEQVKQKISSKYNS